MSKNPRRHRLPHESSPLKRILLALGAILLCGIVLGGFWLLSRMGPQPVDHSQLGETVGLSEETMAYQLESIEYEARFEEILVLREPTREDIELLERALEEQRKYIAAFPSAGTESIERLELLNERYQSVASREYSERSEAYEKEARKLAESGDLDAARGAFMAALKEQRMINENYPLSSTYDAARVARLQREADFLVAEPLYQRSVALEARADQFIEGANWAEAEQALEQARALQDTLNREHRGSKQADIARHERLKIKLVGIQSGQDYVEIQEIAKLADARRVAGEHLESASFYDEAARLQRSLNQSFPDSPYASSDRVADFLRKSQTSQSYQLGREIEANHDQLRVLLDQRRVREAIELIVDLRRDIMQMQETYPRSSLNDEDLQIKVRYLNLVQNDIEFIQSRFYDLMIPVEASENVVMLKTEVPQGLYAIIMGTNPSRNRGDANPVDSVSWVEAKSFCQRMSWIVGKPVRLPTENEFRAALGRLRYVVLEDHVWSASNSDGIAQPVGIKEPFGRGYYDLLGNVSEWLESVNRFESEDALHIGGHAQDSLEAIFTVPVRDSPRGERNRMTGFRIVAELSSQ
ncbi:MAG: SUMF1/EgtB/PvdO family nonheme iron enzyme [Coraliomargarita sp.]